MTSFIITNHACEILKRSQFLRTLNPKPKLRFDVGGAVVGYAIFEHEDGLEGMIGPLKEGM